jgi:hypothetical protein
MRAFDNSPANSEVKLNNFPKYISQRKIARFMAHYELYKMSLEVKGSVVECGVFHGGSLLTWAKLSTILEPWNYHRKIIGFDTFQGFPEVSEIDKNLDIARVGGFSVDYDILPELRSVIEEYDSNRPISDIPKIELVPGDASDTIPQYVSENPWLIVSFLYLDFDIYEPSKIAIENFVPLMPKGAILAFDELSNWNWPGETQALLNTLGVRNLEIKQFPWEPNISYVKL